MRDFRFVIFLLLLVSCAKDIKYDSIVYRYSTFGSNDYHLNINNNGVFRLKISANPMDSESENLKIGDFAGTVDELKMKQINKALSKLTSEGYWYHNPEMILDAPIVELTIIEGKNIRTYQTNHPTPEFEKDVIQVFNEICESNSHH